MSHDPAAGGIGSRLVDIANRGMDSVAAATMSLTGLTPAGGEEVSVQAAIAFAAEGASMQAANTAAQEELARTGMALMNIAQVYARADSSAASSLVSSGGQFVSDPVAGGTGTSGGGGLMRATTPSGAVGSAARTPLMAQSIGAGAPSNPSTPLPAAANAASSVVGTGIASLSSVGQSGASGGRAESGLEFSPGQGDEESDADNSADRPGNERLL